MLLHIPAILSSDEVRDVRAILDAAPWQDGRATAGHRALSAKNNLQLPMDLPEAKQLGELVANRLSRNPSFLSAALPLRIVPPRFNRYEEGGHYGNHVDNAVFPIPGAAMSVRTDVSITLFLNDPAEYDGGELIVQDMFGDHSVKLPAGDAIVYPGSSVHQVTPVTRGVRLASFLWAQSLVAADHRRRMLYELDLSIQALATDHPEHGSVDGLTHVYHNLLREWSVT
jgi:PKHD-type hydroxylase